MDMANPTCVSYVINADLSQRKENEATMDNKHYMKDVGTLRFIADTVIILAYEKNLTYMAPYVSEKWGSESGPEPGKILVHMFLEFWYLDQTFPEVALTQYCNFWYGLPEF